MLLKSEIEEVFHAQQNELKKDLLTSRNYLIENTPSFYKQTKKSIWEQAIRILTQGISNGGDDDAGVIDDLNDRKPSH